MKKLGFLVVTVVILFTACPNLAKTPDAEQPPAAGSFDTRFGTNGKVVTDYTYWDAGNSEWYSADMQINAMVLQADGKIVVGGYAITDGKHFMLARYNTYGRLDTSFGTNGFAVTKFGTDPDYSDAEINALAIQPDGKIIAVGSVLLSEGWHVAVTRYTSDGQLDTGFGKSGTFTNLIGGSEGDYAYGIALQSGGKIVLAGSTTNGALLIRLTDSGELDTAFEGGGIVTISISGASSTYFNSLAIDNAGKIVAFGCTSEGDTPKFLLVRCNPDGALDTTFSTDGIVTTEFTDIAPDARALSLGADGKIILAGSGKKWVADDTGGTYCVLAHYLADDGTLDFSFKSTGKASERFSDKLNEIKVFGVTVQPDDKVIMCGLLMNKYFLVRFNADGTMDTSFGSNGFVNFPESAKSALKAIVIQPDNKIIAAGYEYNSTSRTDDFVLFRLWP